MEQTVQQKLYTQTDSNHENKSPRLSTVCCQRWG